MRLAFDVAVGLLVMGGAFLGLLGTLLTGLGVLPLWALFITIPLLLAFATLWYAGVEGAGRPIND